MVLNTVALPTAGSPSSRSSMVKAPRTFCIAWSTARRGAVERNPMSSNLLDAVSVKVTGSSYQIGSFRLQTPTGSVAG